MQAKFIFITNCRAVARALALSYGAGILLALWGTLAGPFNALGWIAVGLNTLLAAAFIYVQSNRGDQSVRQQS